MANDCSIVGDRVWNDANSNGIQDAGEVGVAGVSVNLQGSGADGKLWTADDVYASVNTDANGYYQFSGLMTGLYKIQVWAPTGTAFSPLDQGGNDAVDS